jgi:hypothetical protein
MYTFNSVDLSTYGIMPGHEDQSNIAVRGIYDLPARIGKTFYEWGDEDGVEAYVESADMMFGGRDLTFSGHIKGTNVQRYNYIDALKAGLKAPTGTAVFSTPYGNFNVLSRSMKATNHREVDEVSMIFREPVVDLSGGTLPDVGIDNYTIDSIPMSSFGLYTTDFDNVMDLPETKEQMFTKFGSEGFQMTKRKNGELTINCFLYGASLSEFNLRVKSLYLLFSSTGVRTVKINGELYVTCFADSGFSVTDIHLLSNGMFAKFNMTLKVISYTH